MFYPPAFSWSAANCTEVETFNYQMMDNSNKASLVALPTKLLVYIILFLSSKHDRVKLRYVSSWLRCAIEGTPSLWKEFVQPIYDSHEEYSVKDVLKVCGQHIKVLSFPNSRVPSTLVEMLQYCSNVQHLSLPSTKLDPEQLTSTIHHMKQLQTLELKMDNDSDIKKLFLNTGQIKDLTIVSTKYHSLKELERIRIKTIKFKPYFSRNFSCTYTLD